MIELKNSQLIFRFPKVHPKASCGIGFQRTLRIPDDDQSYPLPPGLGLFPLDHVDDYASTLPPAWKKHGGAFLPMYQAESMWINFSERYWGSSYPCTIKISAGKNDAVSGQPWSSELQSDSQNYVVSDSQLWLAGFNVAEGLIRQFVTMPLGEGFTAEEQITGKTEWGGIQILVYPMKREAYHELIELPQQEAEKKRREAEADLDFLDRPVFLRRSPRVEEMRLAPGGLMKQEIYADEYGIDVWDCEHGSRCFVHIYNGEQYQIITGQKMPTKPPTPTEYNKSGLPWFDYYSDGLAIQGSGILGKLTGVAAKTVELGKGILPNNEPVQPTTIKTIYENRVRDGEF